MTVILVFYQWAIVETNVSACKRVAALRGRSKKDEEHRMSFMDLDYRSHY